MALQGQLLYDSSSTSPDGRDATVITSESLTLALSLANSSASLPFFLALEETEATFPSILAACLVFFSTSLRSLPWTTAAFLLSPAWSLGRGNCSFIPATPAKAVSGVGGGGLAHGSRACQVPGRPQTFRQYEWKFEVHAVCVSPTQAYPVAGKANK